MLPRHTLLGRGHAVSLGGPRPEAIRRLVERAVSAGVPSKPRPAKRGRTGL